MTSDIPFNLRISCTVNEACAAASLGRTTIYGLIGTGRLRTRKFGTRTLILVDSLMTTVNAAPTSDAEPAHRAAE